MGYLTFFFFFRVPRPSRVNPFPLLPIWCFGENYLEVRSSIRYLPTSAIPSSCCFSSRMPDAAHLLEKAEWPPAQLVPHLVGKPLPFGCGQILNFSYFFAQNVQAGASALHSSLTCSRCWQRYHRLLGALGVFTANSIGSSGGCGNSVTFTLYSSWSAGVRLSLDVDFLFFFCLTSNFTSFTAIWFSLSFFSSLPQRATIHHNVAFSAHVSVFFLLMPWWTFVLSRPFCTVKVFALTASFAAFIFLYRVEVRTAVFHFSLLFPGKFSNSHYLFWCWHCERRINDFVNDVKVIWC